MLLDPEDGPSIPRQATMLSVSRSSLYYQPSVSQQQLDIMHRIDEIYTLHPYYGSRRISILLQQEWVCVGRKKVRSFMQRMGLVAQYPPPNTSASHPGHTIYPYLLRGYAITKANDVRCADITYIRMPRGRVYLIAIMDVYSRKILSWRLSPSLELDFCTDCLREALRMYGSPKIFNTDQWSQFTSHEFTGILLDASVQISMDGKWRALDNIYIERFRRTLKQEEVYPNTYETPLEAYLSLKAYISLYNSTRLHSALRYSTPDQFYTNSLWHTTALPHPLS